MLGKVGGLEGENPRFRVEGLSPSNKVPPLTSGKQIYFIFSSELASAAK